MNVIRTLGFALLPGVFLFLVNPHSHAFAPLTCSTSGRVPVDETISVTGVGDLLLHKQLLGIGLDHHEGFRHLWSELEDDIGAADIAYVNLEGTMADDHAKNGRILRDTPATHDDWVFSGYPMFNYPSAVAVSLAASGFDVVGTANNHSLDRYRDGVAATRAALQRAGLTPFGTVPGREKQLGDKGVATFMTDNGVTVGWVGCSYETNVQLKGPRSLNLCYRDQKQVLAQISRVAKRVDLTVFAPHWGREHSFKVSHDQRQLARKAVERGADLILGAHPHVIGPQELIDRPDGGKVLVAYSLGNFTGFPANENLARSMVLTVEFARQSPAGEFALNKFAIKPYVTEMVTVKSQSSYKIRTELAAPELQFYRDLLPDECEHAGTIALHKVEKAIR